MQILASIAAGTTPDKVTVNTDLLGGGFGRAPTATTCSRRRCWPRRSPAPGEDDLEPRGRHQNDKFRPLTAQRVEIGLDANDNIVGWRHRIVNESYFARILPPELFAKIGKQDVVSGGGGDMSYAVPNHRSSGCAVARGVDVGAWRGIAAGYTKFAIETLIDEIAALQGHGSGGLSARVAQGRSARRGGGQDGRRDGRHRAQAARAGRSASPIPTRSTAIPRRRPKSRSTRRPARSRSITSGPRSTPASRCSRRTSWRRWRAP